MEKEAKEKEEARKRAEFEALPEDEKKRISNQKEAEAKKNQGNEFYKKRKFSEAITAYTAAVELDPQELTYYTNIAACYFELAEYEKCIEQCEQAITVGRSSGAYDYVKMGKAIARKANALFKLGKMEESLQAYDEALLENNHYDIKEARKKVEKAKKEAEAAAYVNPEIAEQHKARGNELF